MAPFTYRTTMKLNVSSVLHENLFSKEFQLELEFQTLHSASKYGNDLSLKTLGYSDLLFPSFTSYLQTPKSKSSKIILSQDTISKSIFSLKEQQKCYSHQPYYAASSPSSLQLPLYKASPTTSSSRSRISRLRRTPQRLVPRLRHQKHNLPVRQTPRTKLPYHLPTLLRLLGYSPADNIAIMIF
jgi:hypothetical protein